MNTTILLLSLLTTLFLQVLSNLANDYGDSISGVDSEVREGPQRAVQAGKISSIEMKRAVIVFSLLSLACGCWLLFEAFYGQWKYLLIFLGMGLASIAAAITYTVGKNPYGYVGLGDLFVFIFFGWVGVFGSYFLHTSQFNPLVLFPASVCGLLSIGVLNVNNIRDIESDKKAGKKSIPVRIGKVNATRYHGLLLVGSVAISLLYGFLEFNAPVAWLFVLVYPLWGLNYRAVMTKSGMDLDPYLRQLAISTLLFVLLFGLGIYLQL